MSVEQPPVAACFTFARNAAQTWLGQSIDVFAEVELRMSCS